MGENSETPEPQNTENGVTETEMKTRRDSMQMEFSPEQRANASSFVAEIKDRFSDQPDKYKNFVVVLSDIMRNGVPEEVASRIEAILQGHDDLIHKLTPFLPSWSTSRAVAITEEDDLDDPNRKFSELPLVLPATPLAPTGEMVKEDDEEVEDEEIEEIEPMYSVERIEKQGIRFCQQVRRTLARAEDYFAFLNLFHCYISGKIVKEQLENRVVRLTGEHSDLIVKFKLFLNRCENFHTIEQEKAKLRLKKQKLDERNKGRDTVKYISTSYCLLPKDHQVAATTNERSNRKSEVLNDCCAAKPPKTKSSNYECKQNPESLEDLWDEEKCEIEVLLGWIKSARRCGKELEKGTRLNKVKGPSGIHLKRCIIRLYGDHGPEILTLVEENQEAAVPIVMARLKQKKEELKKFNEEFNAGLKQRKEEFKKFNEEVNKV